MSPIDDSHPLLLHNLLAEAHGKAAFSPNAYLEASVRTIEGYGSKGAKYRPFNPYAAVKHFASWVYKATMLNANAVARIPLRLYVRRRQTGAPGLKNFRTGKVSGKRLRYFKGEATAGGRPLLPSDRVRMKVAEWDGEFDEVTEPHPALVTLTSVNPWMGGFRLTQLRMIYLLLAGNSYTHKVLDPVLNVPRELWPMPSQWTAIKTSKENFIDGYVYGHGTENEKFFPADEVIHNKLPNPMDLHYGMGKVQAIWSALGLHSSKRVMDQAKFDNMNRPDWAVIFDGVKPEAVERFEAKVNEKFQGPANAGKFLAIGAKATLQALNQELAEIGDADRIVEEIAAGFETPVSMLKANDPNRASAQTADTAWLRDTVRPLALGDEEELNEQYLPAFDVGEDAFLAYDPVSFEDETTIRRNASAGLSGGMLTVNESREEIGYAPVPDGDHRFFPSGATGPNASLLGNTAPGQSGERTNENGKTPGGDLPQGGGEGAGEADDRSGAVESPPLGGGKASEGGAAPSNSNSDAPLGLNGAQITAAVDVFNKLRSGTLWREAAVELLVATGLARPKVESAVNAVPKDEVSEADLAFLRETWLTLLRDGTVGDVLANISGLSQLRDKVKVPAPSKSDIEPILPVQDAQGRTVTADLIKDAEGDVVGARVEEPEPADKPAPVGATVDLEKD